MFKYNIQPEYIKMKYNLQECSHILKEYMNLLNNNGTINLSLIRYFLYDKELILNRRLGKNYSSILFTISICYENNLNY